MKKKDKLEGKVSMGRYMSNDKWDQKYPCYIEILDKDRNLVVRARLGLEEYAMMLTNMSDVNCFLEKRN